MRLSGTRAIRTGARLTRAPVRINASSTSAAPGGCARHPPAQQRAQLHIHYAGCTTAEDCIFCITSRCRRNRTTPLISQALEALSKPRSARASQHLRDVAAICATTHLQQRQRVPQHRPVAQGVGHPECPPLVGPLAQAGRQGERGSSSCAQPPAGGSSLGQPPAAVAGRHCSPGRQRGVQRPRALGHRAP
jgi:hypothetical protein